jgi:RecG-like helicase
VQHDAVEPLPSVPPDRQVQELIDRHDDGPTPIAHARHRQQVTLQGSVHAIRIQPRGGIATMECRLRDASGEISIVFLGRRHIGGIEPGTIITVTGAVGLRRGHLEIVNPYYTLAAPGTHAPASGNAHT